MHRRSRRDHGSFQHAFCAERLAAMMSDPPKPCPCGGTWDEYCTKAGPVYRVRYYRCLGCHETTNWYIPIEQAPAKPRRRSVVPMVVPDVSNYPNAWAIM